MGNTCKTCINNDDGLCDRRGILVEDEDSCEHHWAAGKKVRMKRHEKKMDITPELMLSAYNTLIQLGVRKIYLDKITHHIQQWKHNHNKSRLGKRNQ